MHLSIFDGGEKVAVDALSIDPASLYCAFEQVTDGRKKKGKRYPLPLLLTLLLLGKLAGETTVNGIVEWIKERQADLRRQLNWPKRFPTNSTDSEALARCDGQQIVTVIANVLLKARAVEQCGAEPSRLQANKQQETRQPCGDGWQNLAWHAPTRERGTAKGRICSASMSVKAASS
jgi:DDE_Tnp_1-associated